MRTTQQLSLFKKDLRFHGGSLLHGKRRTVRPLSSKDAIHIVLRSTWAYGENSLLLLKNKKDIQRIILRTAKKYLGKVYRQAIVSNHLHLIIKIPNRKNYQTFIRVLSSLIASHVMKMQSFKVFKKSIFKSAAGRDIKSVRAKKRLARKYLSIKVRKKSLRPIEKSRTFKKIKKPHIVKCEAFVSN